MRIAVVGAGGVGGYFGGLLARAGHDLAFIARGAHLAALRADGLRLRGPRGDYDIAGITATDDAATLDPVDAVLFCVKCYDTADAARAIAPAVRPGTMVLTLQNGVDSAARLQGLLPQVAIVPGAAFVSATIESPGVIRYTSAMSSLVFGEVDGRQTDRCAAFRDICTAAGFEATVSPDIGKALWSKFVSLATNAALTGVTRQPAGIVYRDSRLRALAIRSIDEVIAVAAAQGVALDGDQAARSLALLDSFPPGMYASLFHDLDRGRPLEIGYLSGLISRLGATSGVPTPFHDFAYACLGPYEGGRPVVPA